MAVGFVFGPVAKLPQLERLRWYIALGLALTLEFVVLRWANVYGDPRPWKEQPRGPEFTFLSFLDCHKYPPSLCYLLMTIGPALLLLALFEMVPAASNKVLVAFGRVPMFFYLMHLALIFVTGLLLIKCGLPVPSQVTANDVSIAGLLASPNGGPWLAATFIPPGQASNPSSNSATWEGWTCRCTRSTCCG